MSERSEPERREVLIRLSNDLRAMERIAHEMGSDFDYLAYKLDQAASEAEGLLKRAQEPPLNDGRPPSRAGVGWQAG